MDIELKPVVTNRQLRKFINFPYALYAGNPYWCPQIRLDEWKTLKKSKNPAFEFCEAKYWLAYKNGKIAGRIAGIINHKANERWNEQLVRFGWIDMLDDQDITDRLIGAVAEWGRSKGMTGIHGPLGFSDMDHEGMLIDGFNELNILTSVYNYPYYPEHMINLGFRKAADWIQIEFPIPQEVPEKVLRTAEIVENRFGLHTLKAKKAKELLPYARKMFTMLNIAYDDLYGYSQLSEKQIQGYIKQYFGFIRPEFVSLVIDRNDDVVGFGISMPNLTRALQKCRGRLFPFGFLYLLKAIRKNDIIDMYLLGAHPDYHGKGVAALFFRDLHAAYIKYGIKKAISSAQLMDNTKALSIWKNFEGRQIMQRRCWIKEIV